MERKVFREIESRVKEIERNSSLEDFIIATNFDEKHKMIIRGDYPISHAISEVYQDLKDLELADLWDFKCGEFDGDEF